MPLCKGESMNHARLPLVLAMLSSTLVHSQVSFAEDGTLLKGGVKDGAYISAPAVQPYGTPQYAKPQFVGPPKIQKAAIQTSVTKPKPPLPKPTPKPIVKPVVRPAPVRMAPKEDVLPPQFLGRWSVSGQRSSMEGQPQYQSALGGIFAATTSNTWNVTGDPDQGYLLTTDSGVSTPLSVHMENAQTAVLQYKHPINKTLALEAVVLQLNPGGTSFSGLERISIVKPGEPAPRAKVTYKLFGRK